MKKLSLNLEDLSVESFDTGEGGVHGRDTTTDCTQACSYDCEESLAETACGPCPTRQTHCHQNTCVWTCNANDFTCDPTCNPTICPPACI